MTPVYIGLYVSTDQMLVFPVHVFPFGCRRVPFLPTLSRSANFTALMKMASKDCSRCRTIRNFQFLKIQLHVIIRNFIDRIAGFV